MQRRCPYVHVGLRKIGEYKIPFCNFDASESIAFGNYGVHLSDTEETWRLLQPCSRDDD